MASLLPAAVGLGSGRESTSRFNARELRWAGLEAGLTWLSFGLDADERDFIVAHRLFTLISCLSDD